MNDWISGVLTVLLGGGLITAVVSFLKYLRERKQNSQDAAEAGIVAPAEAESIGMAALNQALKGVAEHNAQLNRELSELRQRFDVSEKSRRLDAEQLHKELNGLRRALQAAQDYIEQFIAWGHRVAPDEPQPKPPENYRRY